MVSYTSIGAVSLFLWYLSWPVNGSIEFNTIRKESVHRVMYWFMFANRSFCLYNRFLVFSVLYFSLQLLRFIICLLRTIVSFLCVIIFLLTETPRSSWCGSFVVELYQYIVFSFRTIRNLTLLDTSYEHQRQRILSTLCAYLMCLSMPQMSNTYGNTPYMYSSYCLFYLFLSTAQMYHVPSVHYLFPLLQLPYFTCPTLPSLKGAAVSTWNLYQCMVFSCSTMRNLTSYGHQRQRIMLLDKYGNVP